MNLQVSCHWSLILMFNPFVFIEAYFMTTIDLDVFFRSIFSVHLMCIPLSWFSLLLPLAGPYLLHVHAHMFICTCRQSCVLRCVHTYILTHTLVHVKARRQPQMLDVGIYTLFFETGFLIGWGLWVWLQKALQDPPASACPTLGASCFPAERSP